MTVASRRICVDAFWKNEVYEFLGKFWHGDPRANPPEKLNTLVGVTFNQLYQQTLQRLNDLENAGYPVKFVWEVDYKRGALFSECHPTP